MNSDTLRYATEREREIIDAYDKIGDSKQTAAELGISPSTVRNARSKVKKRAAKAGYAPDHDMTHTAPDGFNVKGVSTMYGPEGEIRAQWVKTQQDKATEKQEALLDAIRDMAEPFAGTSKIVDPPQHTDEQILCVYPFGDPHIGMYAWAAETGNDFDLDIAERNIVYAIDQLVSVMPASKQALLITVGDTFHGDNFANTTTRSGNILDVDSRWSKVLGVGVRAFRRCIDRALEKHEIVHVICAIGNHDTHTAIMLAIALEMYYSNNPRVKVDTSPNAFHWHRFGQNLIGVTHGDTVKAADLPGIMAVDRKEDWGQTTYRHFYTGHIHHETFKEFRGCSVETMRTLAGRDAWHHKHGYRSACSAVADQWHVDQGFVGRSQVNIQHG